MHIETYPANETRFQVILCRDGRGVKEAHQIGSGVKGAHRAM
jgi:hypothetical protein